MAQIVTPPRFVTIGARDQIDNIFRNDRGCTDTQGIGNVSDVGSEVVFDQPEESAGALEPEGSSRNRHKK